MKLLDLNYLKYENLFLDRDGVINRLRTDDYVKNWSEFEFMPGILEALAEWSKHFKLIIIVTNQRGVGKNLMSEVDLNIIHTKMLAIIKKHGGRIDRIYYCTAIDDNNTYRKPNIGMALKAKHDFPDLIFEKSIMIGDSYSDLKFAENVNMHFLMYKSFKIDFIK